MVIQLFPRATCILEKNLRSLFWLTLSCFQKFESKIDQFTFAFLKQLSFSKDNILPRLSTDSKIFSFEKLQKYHRFWAFFDFSFFKKWQKLTLSKKFFSSFFATYFSIIFAKKLHFLLKNLLISRLTLSQVIYSNRYF